MYQGKLNKARRGELVVRTPAGYVKSPTGEVALDPDEQARDVIRLDLRPVRPAGDGARRAAVLDRRRDPVAGATAVRGRPGAVGLAAPVPGDGPPHPPPPDLRGGLPLRIPADRPASADARAPAERPGQRAGGRGLPGLPEGPTSRRTSPGSGSSRTRRGWRPTGRGRSRPARSATGRPCWPGWCGAGGAGSGCTCGTGGPAGGRRTCAAPCGPTTACRCASRPRRPRSRPGWPSRSWRRCSRRSWRRASARRPRSRSGGGEWLRHWEQRLERARYEADRAARQYHACEPENRLVARTLERRWDEALRAVQQLEAEFERFTRTQPRLLGEAERERDPPAGRGSADAVAGPDDDAGGPAAGRPAAGGPGGAGRRPGG